MPHQAVQCARIPPTQLRRHHSPGRWSPRTALGRYRPKKNQIGKNLAHGGMIGKEKPVDEYQAHSRHSTGDDRQRMAAGQSASIARRQVHDRRRHYHCGNPTPSVPVRAQNVSFSIPEYGAADRTGRPWTTLPVDRGVRSKGSGSHHFTGRFQRPACAAQN